MDIMSLFQRSNKNKIKNIFPNKQFVSTRKNARLCVHAGTCFPQGVFYCVLERFLLVIYATLSCFVFTMNKLCHLNTLSDILDTFLKIFYRDVHKLQNNI